MRARRRRAAGQPWTSCARRSGAPATPGSTVRVAGLRPLVHRHRLHRRPDAADRAHEPPARRRSRRRAGEGRGRDRAARPQRAARPSTGSRSRTWATSTCRRSPARSRPATHGTGARLGNLSARSRRWSWCSPTAACSSAPSDSDPETLRAARVGLGALGVIVTRDAALRARVHAQPRSTTRCPLDETLERLDELVDSQRPLRVLHAGRTAGSRCCARSKRDDGRRSRAAALEEWWQEIVLENRVMRRRGAHRSALPVQIPRLNRPISRVLSGSRKVDRSYRVFASRRLVRFTEMEYGDPARARSRGAAARARRDRPARLRRRVSDRGPLRRRRRRLPEPVERARHLLHRRAHVPRHGVVPVLPRGRGDHGRLRRPARTGASATSSPPRRSLRATRTGTASRRCAPGSTPTACSRTSTPTACSARRRRCGNPHPADPGDRLEEAAPSPRYVGTSSTISLPDTR